MRVIVGLPLLPFLNGLNGYELLVQQKIVEDFQPASEEEGHVYPGWPRKHEPHKQRADGGAGGARHVGRTRGRQ